MADERVMLITGTSKGIGRYLAHAYAARGFHVIGCSRGPFPDPPDRYHHHQVDVTEEADVVRLVRAVKREFGRLDIVINNAGTAGMNHALLTPTGEARRILETNVIGTFNVSREAAKVMVGRRYGRIVNVGTVAVPLKIAGEAVYSAAKSAVAQLTKVLAKELAPFNITCNAVGPGPIETDLTRNVPQESMRALLESMPQKRMSTCDDVLNVVDFFISPASDAVTAQVVYLGGVSD